MLVDVFTLIGVGTSLVVAYFLIKALLTPSDPVLPKVSIKLEKYEAEDEIDAPVKPNQELVWPDRPGKLQCYDPATMQHIGEVEMMGKERVDELVAKARVAQKQWAKSSFGERRAVLRAIQEYYLTHVDEITRVCIRDSGKTRLGAVLGEITPTCEKISWMLQYGEDLLKTESRGGQGLMTVHKAAKVEYLPLGVLGVLSPFNYVGHNLLNHIVSGLFAGNAVVLKPSEYTSWSADYVVRPVRAALVAAGYSADLIQVVTGMAEAGKALCEADIDKIIFTGSDKVGKLVMKTAADNLTPVVLELGGKDPFILCDDINMDNVVPVALRGVFQNAGQNCIGIERIFVHEKIHDQFVERCVAKVKQMRQGNGLGKSTVDIGAMAMPSACDYIQGLVDDAVAKGAKLHTGGKRNAALSPGQFFEPTVLTGITSDMRIAQEEVFGPVMAIRAWSDENAMIEAVNDCRYALGSSIFSNDVARAKRIASRVIAGMANINDFGINYLCQSLCFGGTRDSGFNCFAGPEGLRALCLAKASTEDRIPGVQTSLPPPFVYPVSDGSDKIGTNLIYMAYDPSWFNKAKGLFSLLTGLATAKTSNVAAPPKQKVL